MKGYLIFILVVIITGSVLAYDCYPTEIPYKDLNSYTVPQYDMKYHGTPTYYWTLTGSNWTLSGYFEPYKFSINRNFRIYKIGCIGYIESGTIYLYTFLVETDGHPDATPPDFSKKKYGPQKFTIDNSYPNYSDWSIYP